MAEVRVVTLKVARLKSLRCGLTLQDYTATVSGASS